MTIEEKVLPDSLFIFNDIERSLDDALRELRYDGNESDAKVFLKDMLDNLESLKIALEREAELLPQVIRSLDKETLFNLECRAIQGKLYQSKAFWKLYIKNIKDGKKEIEVLLNSFEKDTTAEIREFKFRLPYIDKEALSRLLTRLETFKKFSNFIFILSYLVQDKIRDLKQKQKRTAILTIVK